MANNDQNLPAPTLALPEGQVKQIAIALTSIDGVAQIALDTDGFDDDINQIALALDFVLEKLIK